MKKSMIRLARLTAFGVALFAGAAARAEDLVKVGILNTIGDVNVLIADEKGYFAKEGIKVDLTPFDASARMIAPIGTGELDVGGGATAVGLFNAIDRGIGMRMVADKGRTAPGYGYQALVIRKDLIDSGAFKSMADLKGLKIATGAPGVGPLSILNEAAKIGGLKYSDVEKVFMGFPLQTAAMQNRAIDGALTNEPFKTLLVGEKIAVEFALTQDFYPNYEVSLLLYGDKFMHERPEVAKRFMRAFLRAARDYNDAIANGRWRTDGGADEVIGIFARRTGQPVDLIRRITPPAIDPNGEIQMTSIRKDLAFFQDQGDVGNKSMTAEQCIDTSFTTAAAKELGPYKHKD